MQKNIGVLTIALAMTISVLAIGQGRPGQSLKTPPQVVEKLIATTEAGGPNSVEAAEKLISARPESAFESIRKGIAASKEDFVKSSLILTLRMLHTKQVQDFVLQEMNSKDLETVRIAAAQVAYRISSAKVVKCIDGMWQAAGYRKISPIPTTDAPALLAEAKTPEAADAIAKGFAHQDPSGKADTLLALIQVFFSPMTFDGAQPPTEAQRQTFSEKIEALAAGELGDKERIVGMGFSLKGANYSSPRLCDMAAILMAEVFPKRYRLLGATSESGMEEQRVAVLDAWLAKTNRPPRVLIKFRPLDATDAKIDPLIQKLSSGKQARNAAEKQIVALGFPAVGPLLRKAEALPKGSERRKELEQLARQINLSVREVRVVHLDHRSNAFARRVQTLKGKRVSSALVKSLTEELVREYPSGTPGVEVVFQRDNAGPGFLCTVDFGKKAPESGDRMRELMTHTKTQSTSAWSDASYVRIADKEPQITLGESPINIPFVYEEFWKRVEPACQTPALTPVTISFSLAHRR